MPALISQNSFFLCLVSFALFALLNSSLIAGSYSTEEANALLKWAASLQNIKNSNISSWPLFPYHATNSNQNTSPCTWLGISCDHAGSVNRLYLTNAGIIGPLHEFPFSSFPNLAFVDLSLNALYGTIAPTICQLSKLIYLDFSYNNLSGNISSDWGRCPRLATLNIAGNNIGGSIPPEIGNAPQLQALDLSSNHLVGRLPKELGKLSLVKLILNDNQLAGDIPPEFGSLTDLEYLDLSTNELSQSIPENIGNLVKLVHLNLSNNQLSEEIPVQLAKLAHLSELDLSHNFLTGEIPSEFNGLLSLENLNISHNILSGFIPTSFEEMHGLLSIDISHNQLEGPIPNNKAFKIASIEALQGNKGLCGDVQGLQPCKPPVTFKDTSKSGHKILFLKVFFPLFVVFLLLFLLVGFWILQSNLEAEEIDMEDEEELVSLSSFNGRVMHDEIVKATMYLIREEEHSSVYKAKMPSGSIVTVKKLCVRHGNERTYQKHFWNEMRALTEIKHPNIVKLYCLYSNAGGSFLIYEYLESRDLATLLGNDEEAKELDWNKRVQIIKGLAAALSYMHQNCSPPIVHRNITSKNVLLDSQYRPHLSDLGSFKLLELDYKAHLSDLGAVNLLELDSSILTELAGTGGYVAPEFAYTKKMTEKCDVYSFGVLALEVIAGKYPDDIISSEFSVSANDILLGDVMDRRLPPTGHKMQEELTTILKLATACSHMNPQCRPSMHLISEMLSG